MCQPKAKLFAFGLLVFCLIFHLGPRGAAQDAQTEAAQKIDAVIRDFNDRSWEIRADAFYRLLGYESYSQWDGRSSLIQSRLDSVFSLRPDRADRLKLALITLLVTENTRVEEFQSFGTTLTESYTNFYGDVVAAVTGMNDPRGINAIVGAMATGGIANRALARFGPVVLGPVSEKLQSPNLFVRAAAVRSLTTMAGPEYKDNFADEASRQKLKTAFLKAASDAESSVRLAAVYGLVLMPDTDTRAVLRRLSISDPSILPGQADDGSGPFYPVRQAAKRALDQIGPATK